MSTLGGEEPVLPPTDGKCCWYTFREECTRPTTCQALVLDAVSSSQLACLVFIVELVEHADFRSTPSIQLSLRQFCPKLLLSSLAAEPLAITSVAIIAETCFCQELPVYAAKPNQPAVAVLFADEKELMRARISPVADFLRAVV